MAHAVAVTVWAAIIRVERPACLFDEWPVRVLGVRRAHELQGGVDALTTTMKECAAALAADPTLYTAEDKAMVARVKARRAARRNN